MRGANRKVFFGLLAVILVFLIVSTSKATVTAEDGWGTLKAGDEMQWQSSTYSTVTIEVLSVEGNIISLEHTKQGNTVSRTIDANASYSDADMRAVFPWLLSLEKIDRLPFTTTTYNFEDTTYQAYYRKDEYSGGLFFESWYDTNTGILFEKRRTGYDKTVIVQEKLTSTTADLAETFGCLGTSLIALVSVTTVISYSLLWKKNKL